MKYLGALINCLLITVKIIQFRKKLFNIELYGQRKYFDLYTYFCYKTIRVINKRLFGIKILH